MQNVDSEGGEDIEAEAREKRIEGGLKKRSVNKYAPIGSVVLTFTGTRLRGFNTSSIASVSTA